MVCVSVSVANKASSAIISLTSKAKRPFIPNLELNEDSQWEITGILEDHTYKRPHCVAELFLNPTHQMDSRVVSLTEIKAVLRLTRNRMELKRYAHHTYFPVSGFFS
ncbi:hypothetical protein BJX62DRAFT_209846 [Aspergillus germanicus]